MARPITWQNVNIDNGASAAAFGNSARAFGDSAIKGFSVFSDQMQDRINREDQLLTNDAIAARLRGENFAPNRRIDQAAVFDVDSRERALKDDLLTASTARRLTTAEAAEQEYFNSDPYRALSEKDTNSQISFRKSQARVNEGQLKVSQAQEARLAAQAARDVGDAKRAQDLDAVADAIDNEEFRLLDEQIKKYMGDGLGFDEASVKAGAFIGGPEGAHLLQQFGRSQSGWDPDAIGLTNLGGRLAQANDLTNDFNKKMEEERKAAEAEQIKIRERRDLYEKNNSLEFTGMDESRNIVPLTDDERKAQNITGNLDEALMRVRAFVPIQNIEKDEKALDAFNKGRALLQNSSTFANAVAGFIDPKSGKFDHKGFTEALGNSAKNIRWDYINRKRAEIGLAGVTAPGTESTSDSGSSAISDVSKISGSGILEQLGRKAGGTVLTEKEMDAITNLGGEGIGFLADNPFGATSWFTRRLLEEAKESKTRREKEQATP